ncbi:MAG: TonB-dependent receptor plug domain-containing protein [Rhodospirillaceae bacterium]
MSRLRFWLLSSAAVLSALPALSVRAQETSINRDNVFGLGEIIVIRSKKDGAATVGGTTVTREQMWTFEKNSLDQAVNIALGVNAQFDSNSRRTESDVFVRGFGRWQVPLMVDGVRIYLPADNRIDFARFLTGDVAEVQIQKGYASVIDGPGAMGGLINLVSRKPTRAFEGEVRAGLTFGDGPYEGWNGFALLGTRQENYYLQASASLSDRNYFSLSDKYTPTATSLQPGERRVNSDSNDWRANFKAGFMPNDTDEYSFNYTRQEGEKGGLLNVYNNPQVPPNSFWRWPWWNLQSATVHSNTAIGDASYLRTKFYYNTFSNVLYAYDDITYTTQSANGRFRSFYEDDAYGTSIEAGTDALPMQTLKLAFHYRVDGHQEYNDNRPTSPLRNVEPKQQQGQRTWSLALEDTYRVSDSFDVVGGVSYDKYKVTRSEEWNSATLSIFEYPKGGSDAFNWQLAGLWDYSATGQMHVSVSSRARFPIFFELYSTRTGTAIPNPNLGPERAANFEVGLKDKLGDNTRVEANVFYSDINDLIQTVQVVAGATPQTQTQNVGDGEVYGFELALDTRVSSQLDVGGNYTYLHRKIVDALQPTFRPTGVPTHKAFFYVAWRPTTALSVTPSLEWAGKRWSDMTTNPAQAFPYIRTGNYALVNLQAQYDVTENVELAIGARNLLDDNYELSWGLPQQGRNYYVKARLTF